MKEILVKAIKWLLPLLGIAVIDSCDMRAEYGCPHSDFEAKGVVTDEDGNGIQGIRVVISAEYPAHYTGDPITDTLWTSHNGEYNSAYSIKERETIETFPTVSSASKLF